MIPTERSDAMSNPSGDDEVPGTDNAPDTTPRWDKECDVCGESPVVGDFGLCGPCCFGEADTAGGNW